MTMLEAALAYARRGWPVFPCDWRQDAADVAPGRAKRAKRPLTPGADKDSSGKAIPRTGGLWRATTDEDQVRAWWEKWPKALIGVPTGAAIGAFVVDLDPRDSETLAQVEARLVEAVGEQPFPRARSTTQSGGLHLWFALPEGEASTPKNSAGRLKGVDWRGDGGYVIAPPSAMSDGAAYAWTLDPFAAGLPDPPDRLLDLIYGRGDFAREAKVTAAGNDDFPAAPAATRARAVLDDPGEKRARAYAQTALDRARADVAGAIQGTRGHTLNAAAYGVAPLVALGMLSEREVYAALRDAADASGLTKADGGPERDAKIRRGLDAGAGNVVAVKTRLDEIRQDARDRAARYGAAPRPPSPPPPKTAPDGPESVRSNGSAEAPAADLGEAEDVDPGEPDEAAGDGGRTGGDPQLRAAVLDCAGLDHSDTDNGRRLIRHFGEDLLVLQHEGARNSDFVAWAGSHWDMRTGADAAFRLAQRIGGRIILEARVMPLTSFEFEPIWAYATSSDRAELVDGAGADEWLKPAIDAIEAYGKRQLARRKFGVSSKNKTRLDAMLACAAPYLTRPPAAWNAHPLRFATEDHTITFVRERVEGDSSQTIARLEAVKGHERGHLITRALPCSYDATAKRPLWDAFLAEFLPNPEVRRFVQVFTGLGLTGLPIQKLVYHYGKGANGKSVFLQVVTEVLGELAMTLQSETVAGMAERSAQAASPDLARLYGRWLVRVPEMDENEPVRAALVKKLTGGEAIVVRNLFKGEFEFVPVAKAHMSGNGFPRIDDTSNGIWRRLAVVEWPVTLELERQRNFADVVAEFVSEAPGILNWMIEGALSFLADGLSEPEEVRHATQDYRDEMDPVGLFVQACLEVSVGDWITGRAAYDAYKKWAEESGMRPRSETAFGKAMKTKVKREDGRVRRYLDVRLKPGVAADPTPDAAASSASARNPAREFDD